MRIGASVRWPVATALFLLMVFPGARLQAASAPATVAAHQAGVGPDRRTSSVRTESLSPPVVASITYITSGADAGKLDIILSAAGTDAATYALCYGTQARSADYPNGYPYQWQRISAAMEMKVPFFGCTASSLYFALVSVNASGTPDALYSNEINASIGATIWPTNTVALTSSTTHLTSDHLYTVSANITFASGSSLTIDPGVVIKVLANTSHYGITVNGMLAAAGESFRKIFITSSKDTTVGGGSGTTPAAGDWGSLSLHDATSTGSVLMDQCEVRYGGYSSSLASTNLYVNYFPSGTTAMITNTTFSYSGSDGLKVWNYDGSFSDRTLYIDSVTSSYNAGSGIYLDGSAYRKVILTTPVAGDGHLDLTATNNGRYPVEIASTVVGELQTDASQGPSVVASANTLGNAVAWNGGTIAGNRAMHWFDVGIPYMLLASCTFDPGTTVTLDPGVIIKVAANTSHYGITINGTFSAQGQSSGKIYITSSKDTTVGGGSGTTPAAGDWGSLSLHGATSTGSVLMDQCEVRYGGYSSSIASTNLYVNYFPSGTTATITNTTFSYSGSDGLKVWNYDGSFSDRTLYIDSVTSSYNAGSGIYLDGSAYRKVILTTPVAGDGHLDLTATNNGRYPVEIASTVVGELQTDASQGPSVVASANTLGNAVAWNGGAIANNQVMHWFDVGIPYVLLASCQFSPGTAMTLDPGVVIKIPRSEYDNLSVQIDGTLTANGTKSDGTVAPIVFTSWNDNTIGGTTGDPAQLVSGGWANILFHNTSSSGSLVLNHCEIRWGGHAGFGGSLVVNDYTGGDQIDIRNTTISRSGTAGVLFYGHDPQAHKLVVTACTIKDCTGPAIDAFNYVSAPLFLATPQCAFTGNNGGRPNPQMTFSGTNPVFVDASLCYWGYGDLDGWPLVPDGWRVTPWYTGDPVAADLLALRDWTGNFNPAPGVGFAGYKASARLALDASLSRTWRMKVFGPNSETTQVGSDVTPSPGTSFDQTWSTSTVPPGGPDKYVLLVTDDNNPTAPAIRADVWADPSLYAIMTIPEEAVPPTFPIYGNISEIDLKYQGVLEMVGNCGTAPAPYITRVRESVLQTTMAASTIPLGSAFGTCVGSHSSIRDVISPSSISNVNGTHLLEWGGTQHGKPASWLSISRQYLVSNLNITMSAVEACGSPSPSNTSSVTLTVDAGSLNGTLDPNNLVVKVVRRRLVHDSPLCNYCIADDLPTLPSTATFSVINANPQVLSNPQPINGQYIYTWPARNHGDGLYSWIVQATATVGGTVYTRTFWDQPEHQALGGWVRPGGGGTVASTEFYDPDNCGRFKYDGRHLLMYSFNAGWDAFQYSTGGGGQGVRHPAPLIMSIHGGILSSEDVGANLSRTLAPLDGIGSGARTWYWDGVLQGHQIMRQTPTCPTCGGGRKGVYIAEELLPDVEMACVQSCPRTTIQLAQGEFVLGGYGDLINPILSADPKCSLDPNANGKKLAVSGTALPNGQGCGLTVKLWALGEVRMEGYPGQLSPDPNTPVAPALISAPGDIVWNGDTFTWSHVGVLPNGYPLKEGLYEAEVIATDLNGAEQHAYQVLPLAW